VSAKHKHARPTMPPLPPPPAWLRGVPDALLEPQRLGARPARLVRWLRSHGIAATPTLSEIESERAARGFRGLTVSTAPRPVPVVLPMPADVLTGRARTNRARIVEALDGLTLADVEHLVDQIREEERRANAEARREDARTGRAA
jgi:hypothetical protein